MPRPNPPRKRPRKRPDAQTRTARADAALTKQTAQSTQPKQAPSKPADPSRGAAAAAPALPDLWSRRSYAVLIAIIAVLQVPISTIEWAAEPSSTRGALYLTLIALNPISLLIASLFAVPIAKFITREQRSLKFVESLVVGLIIFAIWFFLFTVVATAISTPVAGSGTSNCGGTASGVATPVPASASAAASSATPCPSPSASLAPPPSSSPVPSGSSAASPSASANGTGTAATSTIENTPRNYAALAATNLAAFVLAVYVYPPVYRRFRFRPRPPSTASRGGRNPREAKKK
jgi:hypothetical protein